MAIKVIFFGQLKELTNGNELEIDDVKDTNELQQSLYLRYPALASLKYRIAVDKEMISDAVTLQPGTTVALLPPFSGG
jgi:molybdopterin synthase sulfur carrier subunit